MSVFSKKLLQNVLFFKFKEVIVLKIFKKVEKFLFFSSTLHGSEKSVENLSMHVCLLPI